ncbi:MAG: hypothetical protein V4580_13100 [Bacteroidota bacterium]
MFRSHIQKQFYTIAFTLVTLFAFSQTKSVETIKITSDKFSKVTGIKELVVSIPKEYEIESTEYVFNDGKPEPMKMNGNEIPISITGTDLINKKGTVMHLSITYFKDQKVLTKKCKVIIE